MPDKEIPMLNPEFKEAWEKASCFGNSKCFEERAKLPERMLSLFFSKENSLLRKFKITVCSALLRKG